MQINSIKIWLLLVINLVMICSLSFTAIVSYHDALHELDEIYDAQLARNARLVGALLNAAPDFVPEHPLVISVPELGDTGENLTSAQERAFDGHKYERKLAFQVWRDNHLIISSENTGNFPSPKMISGYHEIKENGMHWISFSLQLDENTWIYSAQREDIRQEISDHIAQAQIRPILLMMLPLSLMIYFVVKIILRPLDLLQQSVASKKAEQLTEITLKQPVELQPIQQAINQLIQRVNHYIQQERRFVADAAHELRTPLSILQLHAQNLQLANNPQDITEATDSIIDGGKRMTHLVNQLLTLSRLERVQNVHRASVPLHQLVQDSLSQVSLKYLEKICWEINIPDKLIFTGDIILFQSALRNIFDNASKYSPDNSHVFVSAEVTALSEIKLKIRNHYDQDVDISRMGNRFFRHQSHQHIEGTGLGLSIVQRIIELHDGSLIFKSDKPHELITTITLPSQEINLSQ